MGPALALSSFQHRRPRSLLLVPQKTFTLKMETKSCLSFLLLLLLGLSQATPLVEEKYDAEMEGDDLSISSIILSRNNASDEFLLEGDMVAPKTRNAMTCWSNGCRWQKDSQGK